MKKLHFTLLLFLMCIAGFCQIKPNTIGVCYLQKTSTDNYEVSLILPSNEINEKTSSISFCGQGILFDSLGEIGKIEIDSTKLFYNTQWCENDFGIQFRFSMTYQVRKQNLKRQLYPSEELQNICCFIILNKTPEKNSVLTPDKNAAVKFKGDYNNDGKTDCLIYTYLNDAGICKGKPENNLNIVLQTEKEQFQLRCCGP